MVFGIPWDSVWTHEYARPDLPALLNAVERMKAAGAIIVNGTEFPAWKDHSARQVEVYEWSMMRRWNIDFYK